MLGALALTPVLLVLSIWNAPQLDVVREHPAITLAGGALVALAIVIPLALLVTRNKAFLPLAALVALPFRIPIEAGGETANLLVPLYLVIAAGALAWAVPRVRDGEAFDPPRENGAMEWLLAGLDRPLRAAVDLLDVAGEGARADRLLLRPVRAAVRGPARRRVVAEAAAGRASTSWSGWRWSSSRSGSSSTRRAR